MLRNVPVRSVPKREMFNYILYRIGEFIALHLPVKFGYWAAVMIADIRYIFAHKDRKASIENLKAIFPETDKKKLKKIRQQMFRNFAKYLVDFFRFEKINRQYLKK